MKRQSTPLRRGRTKLRPRARIIRALGEDLISNETIALVELIKNAYDADATEATVCFESPLQRDKGAIVVTDDGYGMTLEVVKSSWFEPATASKRQRTLSPGGRRVTGEKGIGRFAAARLAQRMTLETIARRPRRLVRAVFDWDAFRDETKYLDQITCTWEEHRAPREIDTGTTIRLEKLRDDWDDRSIRQLRGELARLVIGAKDTDFNIVLKLPTAFRDYAGKITPPPILRRPHYTIKGTMSAEGHLKASVKTVGKRRTNVDENIRLDDRKPTSGPFDFEFKVWDLDRLDAVATKLGSTITNLKRDLKDACGISLYRDSFRVMPYGGPANDWLRLDLRRVQNPTLRVSNNQVAGSVHVRADENSELRDQTNREGLVECQALDDFRRCIVSALAHLETVRYAERRRSTATKEHHGLFVELDIEPIVTSFKERYPKDREFLSFVKKHARQVKSSVKRVQEVLARYRRLATLGLLIDVVLHEGRTPVTSIANECDLARRDLKKATSSTRLKGRLKERLDTITGQTEVLSQLLRRIAPFGGRKRGRPEENIIEDLIADTFKLLETRVKGLGVRTVLPETEHSVTADPTEIQQILVNLLENALYWLQQVPKSRRAITVRCKQRKIGLEILFSDSGPGVPEDICDLIFDPYFTTKPAGVGLGLTIAGEIAKEYDGDLELVSPGPLPGANFRLTLRRRVSTSSD